MPSILINEFQPNPVGADPVTTTVELSGTAGDSFSGWLVSIESDAGAGAGTFDRATAISGVFDVNSLLSVDIPDLENPSFTLVLSTEFNASVGEVFTDASVFGTVQDAIGIPDAASDEGSLFGAALGGTDFAYTGDEPRLVFRDSQTGALFAVNDPDNGELRDVDGNAVSPADFDADPLGADTFGAVNPGFTGTTPPPPSALVINEIRIDQPGADNDEYFELAGTPSATLDGLSYVVIGDGAGGSGTIEAVVDLNGQTIGADGYFLAAEDTFTITLADLTTSLNFENSDNVTHLLVRDFTGANGADLDLDDDGVLDVTPWSEVVDSVALIATPGSGDQVYSTTQVGPDGSFVPGHVFRSPDGSGPFQIGDFGSLDGDRPGVSNDGPPPPPPPAPPGVPRTIMEIQGAGHSSAVAGTGVVTAGIVTAVDSNGFYLQDALGDGDIATSDAIFVFTGSAPTVAVGDGLEVTGEVSEFVPGGASSGNLSTTQISGSLAITTLSTGNALPASVILGQNGRVVPNQNIDDDGFASFDPETDGIDFFESLESMRVTAEDLVAVSGTNGFGEIFAVTNQGATASGISDRGTLNLSPDDFNPERIQIDEDEGIFDLDFPSVNTGDLLGDVTGVLGYSFGNFEILPTEEFAANVVSAELEPETTGITRTIDQLTVATYNVLNLDPVVEDPALTNSGSTADVDDDVGDGRFDAIAQQIVNNLGTPDILGLQEIQDMTGAETGDGVTSAAGTLELLIERIVAAGGPEYSYVDNTFIGDLTSGGQPGGNIRTAFLYDPSRVSLVDGSVQTIGSQDPGGAFEGARLPLVATFQFNGEDVTVVNNHLSSKGGSAPILGVEQPFEALQEDPSVNGSLDERQAQSQAVQEFVTDFTTGKPGANVVVLGDFNEFEFVSPVTGLESVGLTNLAPAQLDPDEIYSFNFQGNSQALDHILVSDPLLDGAEVDIVHVNSEFAALPSTASDHDPIVAGLTIELPRVALGVEFDDRRGLTSNAFETIDGERVDRDVLGPLRNSLNFKDVGIKVDAIDPNNIELVAIHDGAIGVRSLDDRLFGFDTIAVDGDERLSFDIDPRGLGDAVEFEFSFGEVRGNGGVEVDLYDGNTRVGSIEFDASAGDAQGDLLGVGFDRVEISAVGDTLFTIDAFEFGVVEDQTLLT